MPPVSAPLSPMAQAALQVARRGWPVFPCRERDESFKNSAGKDIRFFAKAPYGGAGFKDATREEGRIAAWWRDHPDAMIGVPLGVNGCFVVDFDPRVEEVFDEATGEVLLDDDGKPVLREWTLERMKADLEALMGVPLPPSLTSRTPSGGVHVWFRQPDDGGAEIRNSVGGKALTEHIDVRGHGGYVVGPPSWCAGGEKASEGEYRWIGRLGDWRDDAAIAVAPPELIALLRAPKKKVEPVSRGSAPAPARRAGTAPVGDVDSDVRKYALRALDGECEAIRRAASGTRNHQLNESAFKVATLVAAGALDDHIARLSVEAAARDNPGEDDERQLTATINSGWTAGLNSPRDLTEIAAASRSRRERGSQGGSGGSPRPPVSDINGKPSSQSGASGEIGGGKGSGGEDAERLTRECALLPHTDLGNLQRFLRRYGRDFLYVEAWGWLAWDGTRWSRDLALPMLGRAVQDTMRAIQDEADLIRASGCPVDPLPMFDAEQLRAHEAQQRGKLDRVVKVTKTEVILLSDTIARWGRTSESAGHIGCIAKMAEARLSARTEDFDADPLAVNVQNGTLIFARPVDGQPASATLRPHRRRDRMTKIATATYDPAATSPKFDAFLAEVQPIDEMRAFLDVWGGYNMLGDASAQKMALFYGEGSNGKGVWINTVAHLLGDYAWAAAIETFIDQGKYRKGSDASPDLASMAGRRMVYANEPEENSKFSDGLIKAMTSDEPIGGVRELLKPPFQLLVTFKNTVSANNKPKIGTDHGIQRRVQVVPWDVTIPTERADPQLKNKLKAEGSGILNRLVRGALAYLTTGIPVPDAVREATEAYKSENDILGQFLDLCIARVPGETIGSTALHDLFAAWQTWAQLLPASGKPWSPKYLAAQMEKRKFVKRKSSTMMWNDIAARFEPGDFVDHNGKPVERELPAPRVWASEQGGSAVPSAPPPHLPRTPDDYEPAL